MKQKISIWGIILILVGAVYFLRNFIDIPTLDIKWSYVWPIILIVWGVKLILKRNGREKRNN